MNEADETMTPELRLLLACAQPGEEKTATIRQLLEDGIDWTAFTCKAMEHGLVSLAGRTLTGTAADLVPAELLDAFIVNGAGTAERNTKLFAELTRLVQSLAKNGIKTIPFKGPVTAIQGYGDLALREFRDLDFLIRDADLAGALDALQALGYERQAGLTLAQLDMIHRVQGQEIIGNKAIGLVVEPHTRLTSAKLALDIDYAGLWRRAEATSLNGRMMLTMAPEDHLILLAVHGGKELWWRINWACDVAAFIEKHPDLDWNSILERARAQGCLRMVLLAVSLARLYFNSTVPQAVVDAERTDPKIESLVQHVVTRWLADGQSGPPTSKSVSMDLLRLHDGWLRRVRYVLRTWFLPAPAHIGWIALPRVFSAAYVPLKLVHDGLLFPLWQAGRCLFPAKDSGSLQNVEARLAQAESLRALERDEEAIEAYRAVLDIDPDNVTALVGLGNALRHKQRDKQAREMFWRALALEPENPEAYCGLGIVLRRMGKYDEAAAVFRQALTLRPNYADAIAGLGRIHLERGELAAAKTVLTQAMEIEPDKLPILSNLALTWRIQSDDPLFANLKALLPREPSLPPRSREQLHFALAKAYDETGDRERGFHHQLQGNALRRSRARYNEKSRLDLFEKIRTVFSADLIAAAKGAGDPSQRPVFVVGMPRSGSTLIEQIVSSHPKVFGAGEREILFRAVDQMHNTLGLKYPDPAAITPSSLRDLGGAYLQSISAVAPPDATRIVDKLLGNFRNVGLIHLALPNAKIIHARRDPVDTCLSCFSRLYGEGEVEFTYDLGELGRYYRAYSDLMAHWRAVLPPGVMLEVPYESVVRDVETMARRIVDHCGLEWDDACLYFYQSSRPVATASVAQVRQPIYHSSVGRWRPNEELLQPLLSALAGG